MKINKSTAGKLLFALAAGVLAVGCAQTQDKDKGTDNMLAFNSKVEKAATRTTTENTWEGTETVQVSIDAQAAVPFDVDQQGLMTPQTPAYWSSSSQTIEVKAWYPETYTAQADQSSAENLQAADLIYASDQIAFSERDTKVLSFYHLPAKVTVGLIAGEGVDDLTGVLASIAGFPQAAFDPETGTLTGSGDNVWITPLADATAQFTYSALVVPQQMEGKQFIRVTLAGNEYFYTPAAGAADLQAGKSYLFNVTVNKSTLDVTVTETDMTWTGTTEQGSGQFLD